MMYFVFHAVIFLHIVFYILKRPCGFCFAAVKVCVLKKAEDDKTEHLCLSVLM